MAQSPSTAYITTNFPELNQTLRDRMLQRKIEFEETTIGPYTVFYGLSEPVSPDQLGVYLRP